jgi:hypothetical protein
MCVSELRTHRRSAMQAENQRAAHTGLCGDTAGPCSCMFSSGTAYAGTAALRRMNQGVSVTSAGCVA